MSLFAEVLPGLAVEWRTDAEQFDGESLYAKALVSCAEDVERLLRAAAAAGEQG